MIECFKQTRFFLYYSLRIIIGKILLLIFPRDKQIAALNCVVTIKNKNSFTHNTKFLYLYLSQHPEYNIKPVWISTDKKIVKTLNDKGYIAFYKYSLKGLYYCLKAKYYILNVDTFKTEISRFLSYGAILINCWHGIPLKTIGFDLANRNYSELSETKKKIYKNLFINSDYMISNGKYDTNILKHAFWLSDEKVVKLGAPRTDILFNDDIKDIDIFIEDEIHKISEIKKSGKKILLYIPTYRDTKENVMNYINSEKLKDVLNENNAVLIIKLHPVDVNNFNLNNEFIHKLEANTDINTVLKYADILITDYSSASFDYLLLDRPIIYYVPDLEKYQEKCHTFYMPFKEYAAGETAKNEDELINAMTKTINGIDNFKEQRKILRDMTFTYQDGKNCERIAKWIKSL